MMVQSHFCLLVHVHLPTPALLHKRINLRLEFKIYANGINSLSQRQVSKDALTWDDLIKL